MTGVNIRARAQFAPEITALNPFGKVPILVEYRPGQPRLVLFESGAILLHLADGTPLLPTAPHARAATLQWLMVALTGLGPATGQAHHWTELAPEPSEPARRHTIAQVDRAYALLEGRLARTPFLAGPDYSIADIAAYPWVARHRWADRTLHATPHMAAWLARLAARPGVQRGETMPKGAVLA